MPESKGSRRSQRGRESFRGDDFKDQPLSCTARRLTGGHPPRRPALVHATEHDAQPAPTRGWSGILNRAGCAMTRRPVRKGRGYLAAFRQRIVWSHPILETGGRRSGTHGDRTCTGISGSGHTIGRLDPAHEPALCCWKPTTPRTSRAQTPDLYCFTKRGRPKIATSAILGSRQPCIVQRLAAM